MCRSGLGIHAATSDYVDHAALSGTKTYHGRDSYVEYFPRASGYVKTAIQFYLARCVTRTNIVLGLTENGTVVSFDFNL